jgi:hypothetical protein
MDQKFERNGDDESNENSLYGSQDLDKEKDILYRRANSDPLHRYIPPVMIQIVAPQRSNLLPNQLIKGI